MRLAGSLSNGAGYDEPFRFGMEVKSSLGIGHAPRRRIEKTAEVEDYAGPEDLLDDLTRRETVGPSGNLSGLNISSTEGKRALLA